MPEYVIEDAVDFDHLALYDEKIKQVISAKANSADLGTAAAATVETTGVSSNTTTLPTTAQVKSFVEDKGYQTSSDVSSAISGKADTADLGTAAAATVETTGVSSNTTTLPTTAQVKSYVEGQGYQTAGDVSTAISSAISGITGVNFEIVQSLPQTGSAGVIYLLSNSGSAPNVYDEYIYVSNAFEKIGTTDVDLSGYVQTSDITVVTNDQINALFA